MTSAIEKDILIQRLRIIAPDHVERAIIEARNHAVTKLSGTFSGYLDWCIERGMAGAPMPWVDDGWELRRKAEMIPGREPKSLRDLRIAFDRWGDVFQRFAPEITRSRRLREQSWRRRKTGRAVK